MKLKLTKEEKKALKLKRKEQRPRGVFEKQFRPFFV